MKKYHVIIEDVQSYVFDIELPDNLTEDELHEAIYDYCAENRCDVWRSGEEQIVALDDIT